MRTSCNITKNTAWLCVRLRVLFLGVLFFSSLAPSSKAQDSTSLDLQLFRAVNATQLTDQNGFFEILDLTTLPVFGAVPAGFLVHGWSQDDPATFATGVMLAVSELGSLAETFLLKETIRRPRPFETLQGVRVKHRWSATGFAFPSGHTSGAFSLATVLALRYPKIGIIAPVIVWSIAVGYSRIYLGVHFPSDVLGGAVLGTATAIAVWQFRSQVEDFSLRMTNPSRRSPPVLHGPIARMELISIDIPFH